MLRVHVLLYLFLFSCRGFSQESEEESRIEFADSLPVTYPAYFQVKSLDCFDLRPLDTLHHLPWLPANKPLLVYYNNSALVFALRENGGLSVWMHQPVNTSFTRIDKPIACALKFETDTTVMIPWTNDLGMSSMDGFGNATHEAGFFIINLRRQSMVTGLQTYRYSAYWEKDKLEETWVSYQPKIETGSITMVETNESPHTNQRKNTKATSSKTIRYLLKGNRLIREP